MVENTVDDTIDGSFRIDPLIIPALDKLRDNPLEDLRSNFACWLVEDLVNVSVCNLKMGLRTYVGEMVLGQHRVGRIGRAIVMENDQLLVLAALNDFRRASIQLCLDLIDDRNHKGCKKREDKDIELVLKILNQIG